MRLLPGTKALVQFPDPVSASNAKQALEGHAIYDGGYNRVRTVLCHAASVLCAILLSTSAALPWFSVAFHGAVEDCILGASGPEREGQQ